MPRLFYLTMPIAAAISLGLLGGCAKPSFSPIRVNPVSAKTSLGLRDVAGFDVYVDGQIVHVLASGTSADGKDIKLRYLQSDDGGENWSTPISLAVHLPVSATAKQGNDVQLAVNGNQLAAVWQTTSDLPGMGPLASAYSDDAGKTWQAGANPAGKKDTDQAHADLAFDQEGFVHAVWLEDPEENGYQSLRYARSDDLGKHWQPAKTLDDSTCSCCWNTLKVAPDGGLNVLYRDMKPRDMALIQSKDHGDSWQKTGRVGEFNWQFDGCPHIGGGLAVSQSDSGTAFDALVWTGEEQHAGLYHLHTGDNARSWSQPKALGKNPLHGDIAVTAEHRLIAVWNERAPEGLSVYFAQSMDNGLSWSAPRRLSAAGNNASHPRVVATETGAIAMWTEKPPKQPSLWAYTIIE